MSLSVRYACPKCEHEVQTDVPEAAEVIACPECRGEIVLPQGAYADGRLHRCLVCPSVDLFARKDFPQRVGVTIVVLGFVISCITWNFYLTYWTFAVLFATAAIDVLLWFVVPNCLNCYRCDAQYRGLRGLDQYQGFDLETHERYRQQEIRLKQAAATARTAEAAGRRSE
jgi:DNA-directed RNA polymerase subunit RPC12/RpoP